ncbi:MAG: hypothetical protein JST22_15985 [Bacteroidetes bacterium]|nr:hypothetical protein [Bacteroidota bacterium]
MNRTTFTQFVRGMLACTMACLLLWNHASAQERQPKLDPEGQLKRLEEIRREGAASEANRDAGEDVKGRDEWFSFVRRYPYDMIPATLRSDAIREMQRQTAQIERALHGKHYEATVLGANSWQQIGPSNVSGRTRAIAVKPGDAQTMFIGAAAGGVWKTVDGGTSWATTTDTLPSLAACALGIDRLSPNIIYMGTGENSVNVDSYLGKGIFKSTDGGLTWKSSGLANVGAFSKIVVHRQKHLTVYAAATKANGGFYRSEDGGATWALVAGTGGDTWDLSINPQNSDELFISTASKIRHSTDGGKTFTDVITGINRTGAIRISVAVSPAQPTRLYALVARDPGSGANHIGEAYVSDNSGASWTLKKTFDQAFFNLQGWYDNCAAADPFDPNVGLVGGIDIYRTTDGGNNWSNVTRSYLGGNVHPDQHVLEISDENPGLVVLGNDGGVYLSFDGAATWQQISKNLPTSQFYGLDVDPSREFRVYGGTQDNGTHGSYGTSSFPGDWQRVLSGDGFQVVVDAGNPDTVYAEQYNGTPLYRIAANNTNSRARIDASISTDADHGDVGVWDTPIAMSPADKKSFFTGRSNLYRSTNRGRTWDTLKPGNTQKISAIGLSNFDARVMMVGASNGSAYYSTDNGANWARSAPVFGRSVTEVTFDPVAINRVYLTVGGTSNPHVYRSDDNGATFKSIQGNLPNISANTIAIDPQDTSHLFVGTDIGVFASLDGGGTWFPFNDGLALSPVVDMKIHKASHYLVAATHGRSMFRVNISGLQAPPLLITPTGGETYATPGALPVRWSGLTGPVRIMISYDGGANYRAIDDNVIPSGDTLQLGVVRTTKARIRVVEISGGRTLESDNFTLNATANCTDIGKKGYLAGAIEYRRGSLWVAVRGSDSLYKYRLPLLGGRIGLVRSGFTGEVRDMAYDSVADYFYMLVADADYSHPHLFRMDSDGVGHGEVTLPAGLLRCSGVTMLPDGIALVAPGNAANVYVIKDDGTSVRTLGPLTGAGENDRRGLAWDQYGLVQGVVDDNPATQFPSLLQQVSQSNPLVLEQSTVLVPPSATRFDFYGLAFDPSNADVTKQLYWATDTSGDFCKCERQKFFTTGVEDGSAATGYTAQNLAFGAITPNPMRTEAVIHFLVRARDSYRIDLYDASGARLAPILDAVLEPGEHSVRFDGAGIASGIYYATLVSGSGDRAVRPIVVVR